jgi:hypothetical protein
VGGLRCNPNPGRGTSELFRPAATACDAPIDALITQLDQAATAVAVQCLAKLQSKLPDYAKNWKVLGSLGTGNPVAVAFALGAAAEGDLRDCGLTGVIESVDVSAEVRADLKGVVEAIRRTQEYLSLQQKMTRIEQLRAEPMDARTLVGDVGDAYMNRREVEGLGKEISDLGQGLAKRLKENAEDVVVLNRGIDGLRGLVEAARKAVVDQEQLAESIRASARTDVTECQIEAADRKLFSAQEAAKRALMESHQALANAREKRVCIAEQTQAAVGGAYRWKEAALFRKSPGLHRKVREFNRLAQEIDRLRIGAERQAGLVGNIGRQCRLVHDEATEIEHMIASYEEALRSAQTTLAKPQLCHLDGVQKELDYLEGMEGGRCAWRLPRASVGTPMSETIERDLLARQRSIEESRERLQGLRDEAIAEIEKGAHSRARKLIDSIERLEGEACLEGSTANVLRRRLRAADPAEGKAVSGTGNCSSGEIAGVYKAAWGPIKCNSSGEGLECCYGSRCKWSLRLAIAEDGKSVEGSWDHNDGRTGPAQFALDDGCNLASGKYGYKAGKLTNQWSVSSKVSGEEVALHDWILGDWTYRTDSGFTDTHHFLPDGSTKQGGSWSLSKGQLVVKWPNEYVNKYMATRKADQLIGISISPDGRRIPSTLRKR